MENQYLQILLKPKSERTISELYRMVEWYRDADIKEFLFALSVESLHGTCVK